MPDNVIYKLPNGMVIGVYEYGYFVAHQYRQKSGRMTMRDKAYFGNGRLLPCLIHALERAGKVRGYKTLQEAVRVLRNISAEFTEVLQKGAPKT